MMHTGFHYITDLNPDDPPLAKPQNAHLQILQELDLASAMTEIYPRLRVMATKISKRTNSDSGEHSDLTMNTIMTALIKVSQFEGKSRNDLFAWLVGIMQNLYRRSRRDSLRHGRVHSKKCISARNAQFLTSSGLVELRSIDPNQEASIHEQLWIVVQAIDTLPSKLKTVVEMKLHDGLTVAEIAEKLQIDKPAVQKRYARALKKLREMYVLRKIVEEGV